MDEVRQVLFGLNGFEVIGAEVDDLDGELIVRVVTVDPRRGCPECGVVGRVKDRPEVKLRDATSAGRRVRVVWRKHRWACWEPSCPKRSWTEQDPQVGAGRRSPGGAGFRWPRR